MTNHITSNTSNSTPLMGNSSDLPPTYDAAVTSEVNCKSDYDDLMYDRRGAKVFLLAQGSYVPAGAADAKDVKVPPNDEQPQYAAPAGPPPFMGPSMPPTTVYNYVNPVTHEVVASLLPPDHPQMVCLQQGHDPQGRFGILGK
ncbi:hypothetical protein EIP86_003389 [Pleurotus ostreatoroseus]|nr:hypothetical protein EIP86_003389 [Pleurotus ostreatoroseus]